MSRHDRKRAERFEARGIGLADLPSAQTAYLGDAGGKCCLCDTNIMHQFLLTFARPGGAVEFFPVGSKCILDWMRAMPESVARAEAIARVKRAEKAMRAQRKLLKTLDEAGDEDAANLMRIFFRLPTALQNDKEQALGDIGQRVVKYKSFSTDKQRRYFAGLVRQAAETHGVNARQAPGEQPTEQPTEQPLCEGDEEGAALMASYAELPEGFAQEQGGPLYDIGEKVKRFGQFSTDKQREFFAGLVKDAPLLARWLAVPENLREPGPLTDMGGKLEQYGSFRTDRQRGFFNSLLKKAEAKADVPPPPPSTLGEQTPMPQGNLFEGRPRCGECQSFDLSPGMTICVDCVQEQAADAPTHVAADADDDPF